MISDTAIISILKEQISAYECLVDLLNRERVCLIDIDGVKVEEISKEKDTAIMRLRLLEEERQRLLEEFSSFNNLDSNINLEELGKITGNTIFPELRSRLMSLLQSIEEMNKFNSVLIDRSLNYLRSTNGFFGSFVSEHTAQTTGVFLSRET